MLLCGLVFAAEHVRHTSFAQELGAVPVAIKQATLDLADGSFTFSSLGRLATLITALFVHGDFEHIGYNMIFLWAFGCLVSQHLGQWWALAAFLLTGICGNIVQVCLNLDSPNPIIGASGAVCGFEGIYLGLALRWHLPDPDVWPIAYPIPPLQLGAFALLGFGFDMYALAGHQQRIAYGAHVGGFLAGLALAGVFTTLYPTIANYERSAQR
jgi:rhomboid family protein